MTHTSRFATLGTAVALLSAVLLIAPTDSYAKKADRDNVAPSTKSGKKFYKATICASSKKPFWGAPKKGSFGCAFGATTVSGEVQFNGKEAKGVWKQCDRQSQGIANRVTWCNFADNGKGSISIGANGEMEGSAQGVTITNHTYWMRIDVFADGGTNLRGGWNK